MQETNSKPHSAEPTISFQGKDKCVNVGKDVIRLLGNPNVSTKVVKIIQSYTGVVNKMVWRK